MVNVDGASSGPHSGFILLADIPREWRHFFSRNGGPGLLLPWFLGYLIPLWLRILVAGFHPMRIDLMRVGTPLLVVGMNSV